MGRQQDVSTNAGLKLQFPLYPRKTGHPSARSKCPLWAKGRQRAFKCQEAARRRPRVRSALLYRSLLRSRGGTRNQRDRKSRSIPERNADPVPGMPPASRSGSPSESACGSSPLPALEFARWLTWPLFPTRAAQQSMLSSVFSRHPPSFC